LRKARSLGRKTKNAEEIDFENWREIAARAMEAALPAREGFPSNKTTILILFDLV
jgi:hypothetical protein